MFVGKISARVRTLVGKRVIDIGQDRQSDHGLRSQQRTRPRLRSPRPRLDPPPTSKASTSCCVPPNPPHPPPPGGAPPANAAATAVDESERETAHPAITPQVNKCRPRARGAVPWLRLRPGRRGSTFPWPAPRPAVAIRSDVRFEGLLSGTSGSVTTSPTQSAELEIVSPVWTRCCWHAGPSRSQDRGCRGGGGHGTALVASTP